MRGALLVIILIAMLMVGVLIVKNIQSHQPSSVESADGTDKIDLIKQAEEVAGNINNIDRTSPLSP